MIGGTAGTRSARSSTSPSRVGAAVVSVEYRLRPRDPHPGSGRGLLRRPGLDGRARRASSASTRTGIVLDRRQRRRRPRGGAGAAGPRPRRTGPRRPAAHVPDARRPQRHPVGAPDGRAADVEPAGQRGRLDGAAGRRPRRPGRLAVRRAGPGRATSPACRRPSSTSARRTPSATRTSTTRRGSGRPAAVAELHVWPGGFHGFDGIVPAGGLVARPPSPPAGSPGSAACYDGRFWMITTNLADGGWQSARAPPRTRSARGRTRSGCPRSAASTPTSPGTTTAPAGHLRRLRRRWSGRPRAAGRRPGDGRALTERRPVWQGTGGRFPEGPHLYRIGEYWYLLIAEGGTERGHAVTIARGPSPSGPFEPCPATRC